MSLGEGEKVVKVEDALNDIKICVGEYVLGNRWKLSRCRGVLKGMRVG